MRVVHDKNVSQSSSNACKDEQKDSRHDSPVPSTIQSLTFTDSNDSLEIVSTSSLVSFDTGSETVTGSNNQRIENDVRTDNPQQVVADQICTLTAN